MRILVSAYACQPGKGSEPGVGWNFVCQIARFHEAWVITRENNRPSIESALAETRASNTHFIYYDLPRWTRFWKKGRRGIRLYYYLWQLGAYFLARKLHRQLRFDLVHHVTFVKYWMPSFLSFLQAPFLWGPVGGAESAPDVFRDSFSLKGRVFEILRDLGRKLGERDPFVRLTARKATLALATTYETADRLRALGCRAVSVVSQVGLTKDEIRLLGCAPTRQDKPFRVVCIGDLLHLKGFHLGLRAFARFQRRFPAAECWVIGKGPERKRLGSLAGRLGVAKKVTFWGEIPRSEVLEKLAECDVLLHPSLHDSGGYVCVEAMAAGRPVVCLDLGGPALQVTRETGIKIPALSPDQAVADMADALHQLARDNCRRVRLGQAGRQRVAEHFNWEKKGNYLVMIYDQVKQEVSSQPSASRVSATLEQISRA